MNRSPRRTEFHFTVTHAVVMVGLTLGCLFAAFLIGYRSGRGAGYQDASLHTIGSAPRFGIPNDEMPQKVPDELVSKVYAKLQENITPPTEAVDPPKLEKIPEFAAPNSNVGSTLGDIAPPGYEKNKKGKNKKRKPALPQTKELERQIAETEKALVGSKKESVVKVETKKTIEKVAPVETELKIEPLEREIEIAKKTQVVKKTQTNTLGGLFELGNTPQVKPKAEQPLEMKKAEVAAVKEAVKVPEPITPKATPPKVAPLEVVEPKVQVKPKVGIQAGWYVQVAAPGVESEARTLVGKLASNGFRGSRIQVATVRGKQYYRVLVGPEDTAVLAERLLKQLSREAYITGKPYLKRISG